MKSVKAVMSQLLACISQRNGEIPNRFEDILLTGWIDALTWVVEDEER